MVCFTKPSSQNKTTQKIMNFESLLGWYEHKYFERLSFVYSQLQNRRTGAIGGIWHVNCFGSGWSAISLSTGVLFLVFVAEYCGGGFEAWFPVNKSLALHPICLVATDADRSFG